jgi:DNA adenine methylase
MKTTAKPFLKWVGGKSQLIPQLTQYLPDPMPSNYAELFLGGGAMFWYLTQEFKFNEIFLNDTNKTLICSYNNLIYWDHEIINELLKYQLSYLDTHNRQKYFKEIKDEFNAFTQNDLNWYKTALLIFLNKTCFNGLYRVNSKGKFNVSHGRYKNPKICDKDNLEACSERLRRLPVRFRDDSYEQIDLDFSSFFIYLDPPYKPINPTSNFTQYAGKFDDSDQEKLAQKAKEWHEQGAKIMISNSFHLDYFSDLYPNFKKIEVYASRSINSNGKGRGKVSELLMINY